MGLLELLTRNIKVENSKKRNKNYSDNKKVIFKINKKTIGEIEMRNGDINQHKRIKFCMKASDFIDLLITKYRKKRIS